MARSLSGLDKNVQLVRNGFDGELLVAEDLYCRSLR
jgi:hypothetical protein